jgi:hypothetical protein
MIVEIGFIYLRIGTRGCCEHGAESSGSTEGGKFLDWICDYQYFKRNYVPFCK